MLGQWAVEGHLHWQSEVASSEDRSPRRVDHSAENYSRPSGPAMGQLRRDRSIEALIRGEIFIVGGDKSYLLRLISTGPEYDLAQKGCPISRSRLRCRVFERHDIDGC